MFKGYQLAAALFFAVPALAQQTVQERMAVMDAQLELVKKQGQLDKALQESAGSSIAALPYVLAVMGMDQVMSARLQLSNGTVNTYRVGEAIRPGMTVGSISPRQVTVTLGAGKSARSVPLEFIAPAPVAGGAGFAPLPGGRAPLPRELLPEPPFVRVPASSMPVAPVIAAPAPAAPPPAAPTPAAPAAPLASEAQAGAVKSVASTR